MSNAIVEALENAAKRIGKSLGADLSKTWHSFLHDTGDRIESSVKAHVEHDTNMAREFESVGKRVGSPVVHDAEGAAAHEVESTATHAASAAPTVRVGDGSRRSLEEQLHDPVVHPDNADIVPKDYNVLGGKTPDEFTDTWYGPTGDPRNPVDWKWPGNRGAVPGSESVRAPNVNEEIDRIGGDGGSFFSPTDTRFGDRALPPDRLNFPRSKYTVDTSVPEIQDGRVQVRESTVAGTFEQSGGGKQLEFVWSDPTKPITEWPTLTAGQLKDLGIVVDA